MAFYDQIARSGRVATYPAGPAQGGRSQADTIELNAAGGVKRCLTTPPPCSAVAAVERLSTLGIGHGTHSAGAAIGFHVERNFRKDTFRVGTNRAAKLHGDRAAIACRPAVSRVGGAIGVITALSAGTTVTTVDGPSRSHRGADEGRREAPLHRNSAVDTVKGTTRLTSEAILSHSVPRAVVGAFASRLPRGVQVVLGKRRCAKRLIGKVGLCRRRRQRRVSAAVALGSHSDRNKQRGKRRYGRGQRNHGPTLAAAAILKTKRRRQCPRRLTMR
ncbi:hypothetical protein QFZ99_005721 [Paraburkholderia atlantica]